MLVRWGTLLLIISAVTALSQTALIPDNFQRVWVHQNGSITGNHGPIDEDKTIEIGGTPLAMKWAVQTAAVIVSTMTRHMDPSLFYRIASDGACAGVFSRRENLTLFPEYASRASGNCGSSCKDECRHTCTSDGRKYEDLPGLGGTTAVTTQENVLCLHWDPYSHAESILAHEFAHSVKFRLTNAQNDRVYANWINAKRNQIWDLSSYAMSTVHEYWAESSQVYFGVQQYSWSNAGNMNRCTDKDGKFYTCKDELEGRENLRSKDPNQYDVLVEVYANGDKDIVHGMRICPPYAPNGFVLGQNIITPVGK